MIKILAIHITILLSFVCFTGVSKTASNTLPEKPKTELKNSLPGKKADTLGKTTTITLTESGPGQGLSGQYSTTKKEPIVKEFVAGEDESEKPSWMIIGSGVAAVILGLVINRFLRKKKRKK